jgi:uncharacterized membrane protein
VTQPPTEFDRQEREVEFSRALAFSDGVFAFAVTLLVTTIAVPRLSGPNEETQLVNQLDNLVPFVAAYFLSFAVVGLLWLRHHRLFSRIHRLDHRALVMNIVLLSFIVLMPFSTEIIARYGDLWPGVAIYAANLAIIGFAYTALWGYCATSGMLGEQPSQAELRQELILRLSLPVGFLLSIPLALASTSVAQLSWLALVIAQRLLAHHWVADGRMRPDDD